MALKALKDISIIQLGLILDRKKAENETSFPYKRLTLRALERDGINPEAIEPFYSMQPLQNDYLTKPGDIIMKLFAPFNPIVITKETECYLFPSQMVSIKTIKSVLPEYLCLYLSQDFVAERLLANYFWIAQKAITVESLLNLKIEIPSLKNQQLICDYNQNYRNICKLRKELDKEEQNMMKYVFSILCKEKEIL